MMMGQVLDRSLRTVAVCEIDADGKLIFERSVACEIEDIVECLRVLPAAARHIGFEAGPMSQYLFWKLCGRRKKASCHHAQNVGRWHRFPS